MLLSGGSRYHRGVVNSSNLNFGLECGKFPLPSYVFIECLIIVDVLSFSYFYYCTGDLGSL